MAAKKTNLVNQDPNSKQSGILSDELERVQALINAPHMREMRARSGPNAKHIGVRPRKASTIIVVDDTSPDVRILMGERNKNLKFMPGALVFPGGAVDRGDAHVPVSGELHPKTSQRLIHHIKPRAGHLAAKGLAVAAVRELAEETGLLIGQRKSDAEITRLPQEFAAQQFYPDLSGLRLLARAVTPPGLSRRFDTWFFIAKASNIGWRPESGFAPSGELERLRWISPSNAINENTREITRVIMVELMNRLNSDPDLSHDWSAPHYAARHGVFSRTIME